MIVNNILRSSFKITIKDLPKYSYGRFVLEFKTSGKKDRLKALQEFLNKTR